MAPRSSPNPRRSCTAAGASTYQAVELVRHEELRGEARAVRQGQRRHVVVIQVVFRDADGGVCPGRKRTPTAPPDPLPVQACAVPCSRSCHARSSSALGSPAKTVPATVNGNARSCRQNAEEPARASSASGWPLLVTAGIKVFLHGKSAAPPARRSLSASCAARVQSRIYRTSRTT